MTGIVPIRPSLAPCSPLSRPLRAASGGGLRPVLTAAVRGVTLDLGRDEETAPPVEQRNYARCQTFLQNSLDATTGLPTSTADRPHSAWLSNYTRNPFSCAAALHHLSRSLSDI